MNVTLDASTDLADLDELSLGSALSNTINANGKDNFGLDSEDIDNLLNNEDTEKFLKNHKGVIGGGDQEFRLKLTSKTGNSSGEISFGFTDMELDSYDNILQQNVSTEVAPVYDNIQKPGFVEVHEMKKTERVNESYPVNVAVQTPPSTAAAFSSVDDLITFQSNINKTLLNLVESIQRTEYTRRLLAKQAQDGPRRNSLDSPLLTAYNNMTTDNIPRDNGGLNLMGVHEFPATINMRQMNSPSPKLQPVKASRRSSLGKSSGYRNRRKSMIN